MEENGKMVALQISFTIESMYELSRQATDKIIRVLYGYFATFARLSFGQFSAENS